MELLVWQTVFFISALVLTFCSGVILGAYLISRRDEKMFEYFISICTEDQESDMINKDLTTEIFGKNEDKRT